MAQEPRYRNVGSVLFELVVRWSVRLGSRGRIGLHSLPQAAGFYEGPCGMTRLGPDPAEPKLHYFELTEDQADDYLKGLSP